MNDLIDLVTRWKEQAKNNIKNGDVIGAVCVFNWAYGLKEGLTCCYLTDDIEVIVKELDKIMQDIMDSGTE